MGCPIILYLLETVELEFEEDVRVVSPVQERAIMYTKTGSMKMMLGDPVHAYWQVQQPVDKCSN
jgi:hypothetical protein